MNTSHVMFSTDGKGNWKKIEWKSQCSEIVFMGGQCQGFEGHLGVHWNFGLSGSFHYDDNENDPTEEGGSGSTPPDHASYKTPLEMANHYYMSHSVCMDVTDPAEIARLENGDTTENESIVRPASIEELRKLHDQD